MRSKRHTVSSLRGANGANQRTSRWKKERRRKKKQRRRTRSNERVNNMERTDHDGENRRENRMSLQKIINHNSTVYTSIVVHTLTHSRAPSIVLFQYFVLLLFFFFSLRLRAQFIQNRRYFPSFFLSISRPHRTRTSLSIDFDGIVRFGNASLHCSTLDRMK